MKLNAFRLRLQVDASELDGIINKITGGTPRWPNGSAIQMECALFFKADLVDDLSNLAKILLEVKPANDITAAALMTGEVLTPDFNASMTSADWESNVETAYHARFVFSSSQAHLDLGGATSKQFHLVLSALRVDGDSLTLGMTTVTVEEDGSSITPTAIGLTFFRIHGGFPELGYEDGTWHALDVIEMVDGSKSLMVVQAASTATADFNGDHFRVSEGYPEILGPDDEWYRITPHIMAADGSYAIDIAQTPSGAYVANSANWRVNAGYGELKFPDGTWHRIISRRLGSEYSIDVQQTASPA